MRASFDLKFQPVESGNASSPQSTDGLIPEDTLESCDAMRHRADGQLMPERRVQTFFGNAARQSQAQATYNSMLIARAADAT